MPLPIPFFLRLNQSSALTHGQLDGNLSVLSQKIDNTTGRNLSSSGISFFVDKTINPNSGFLNFRTLQGVSGITTFVSGNTIIFGLTDTVDTDTFVTGFTWNVGTYDLDILMNNGDGYSVNLSILATDMNVTGGTYNPATGCGTFTNNSGGTFDICGFLTGYTDAFTSAATLNGTTIEFDNTLHGLNFYSVDLWPLLSGFTSDACCYWTGGTGTNAVKLINNGGTAGGRLAVSEGSGTTASGDYSHAEGVGNRATGLASHAEGGVLSVPVESGPPDFYYGTSATTSSAHAEGAGTLAAGTCAHAEGWGNIASGVASHAGGAWTKAIGDFSFIHSTGGKGYSKAEGPGSAILGGFLNNILPAHAYSAIIGGYGIISTNPYTLYTSNIDTCEYQWPSVIRTDNMTSCSPMNIWNAPMIFTLQDWSWQTSSADTGTTIVSGITTTIAASGITLVDMSGTTSGTTLITPALVSLEKNLGNDHQVKWNASILPPHNLPREHFSLVCDSGRWNLTEGILGEEMNAYPGIAMSQIMTGVTATTLSRESGYSMTRFESEINGSASYNITTSAGNVVSREMRRFEGGPNYRESYTNQTGGGMGITNTISHQTTGTTATTISTTNDIGIYEECKRTGVTTDIIVIDNSSLSAQAIYKENKVYEPGHYETLANMSIGIRAYEDFPAVTQRMSVISGTTTATTLSSISGGTIYEEKNRMSDGGYTHLMNSTIDAAGIFEKKKTIKDDIYDFWNHTLQANGILYEEICSQQPNSEANFNLTVCTSSDDSIRADVRQQMSFISGNTSGGTTATTVIDTDSVTLTHHIQSDSPEIVEELSIASFGNVESAKRAGVPIREEVSPVIAVILHQTSGATTGTTVMGPDILSQQYKTTNTTSHTALGQWDAPTLWTQPSYASSLNIQFISGTTTGTTVIGSDLWAQETLGLNTKDIIALGDTTPLSDVWFVWTGENKAIAIQFISGTTTGTTVIGSDAMIMSKNYNSSKSNTSLLKIGDTDDDNDGWLDTADAFPTDFVRLRIRTTSGTTTGTTIVGPSLLGTTIVGPDTTSTVAMGQYRASSRAWCNPLGYQSCIVGPSVVTQFISGGTTGTTVMTSEALFLDKNDGVTQTTTSITPVGITTTGSIVAQSISATTINIDGVGIDPYLSGTTATSTYAWNVSGGSSNFEITLINNTNYLDLTHVADGAYGTIIVRQDATGGRDIELNEVNGAAGTHYLVNGGGSVTLTANPNAVDILSFTKNADSCWWTVGYDYQISP